MMLMARRCSDYVRQHCWLLNSSGRRDGFTPVDRVQEKRIKDIKVTHRPQGPKIDWDYLKKLHPAIPVIQHVSEHIEDQFRTWTRYTRHTRPHDIKGILLLQRTYTIAQLHTTDQTGRSWENDADRASDMYNRGLLNLGQTMQRWKDRRTFARSTLEDRSAPGVDEILRHEDEAMDIEVEGGSSDSEPS